MGKTQVAREFQVPAALCASFNSNRATLDEMEFVAARPTAAGLWARQVLYRENAKLLDDLLGDDTRLPRGVLASMSDPAHEVITCLVNWKGEVWDRAGWHQPEAPIVAANTIDLSEDDVAFIVRALREGSDSVVMRAYMPVAFLAAGPEAPVSATAPVSELPDGSIPVALVDALDKNAVLELLAVAPGPHIYRRNDGSWQEDPEWVQVLKSTHPPSMVKLDEGMLSSVIGQIDEATAGAKFEPFKSEDRERYVPVRASAVIDEYRREADDRMIALRLGLLAVAGRELTPKDVASTEKLRRYWLYGEGAAKIRWFTPGSWRRCYRHLVKYVGPLVAPGYCTNLSQRLGGPGIATHVGVKEKNAVKRALKKAVS